MNKRIIVARANERTQPCVGCRQPWPLKDLDRHGLCGGCWMGAGVQAGRQLSPAIYSYMERVLAAHQGERGRAEDPLQCLLRLLEERLRLVSWEDGEKLVPARCCYCGEVLSEEPTDRVDNLVTLESLPGAPEVFACFDEMACKARMVTAFRGQQRAMDGSRPA